MQKPEQVKYDALRRIRDFGVAHQERFPESSRGGKAFATIAQAVATIDTNDVAKNIATQEAAHTRRALRKALRTAMLDIVRTARSAARRADRTHTLHMPKRATDVALLKAARTFIIDGTDWLAELTTYGLPATAFDDLSVHADALTLALDVRGKRRGDAANHQRAIETALKAGFDAVLELDAVVANALKSDEPLFAGWLSIRRVATGRSSRHGAVTPTAPAASSADASSPTPVNPVTNAS